MRRKVLVQHLASIWLQKHLYFSAQIRRVPDVADSPRFIIIADSAGLWRRREWGTWRRTTLFCDWGNKAWCDDWSTASRLRHRHRVATAQSISCRLLCLSVCLSMSPSLHPFVRFFVAATDSQHANNRLLSAFFSDRSASLTGIPAALTLAARYEDRSSHATVSIGTTY